MNLFDNSINIEDEDLILSLKGQDLSGWQKIANIIDALRALERINNQSWYYGQAKDRREGGKGGKGDPEEPFFTEYQGAREAIQKLTSVEFKDLTPAAVACTLEAIAGYRRLVDATLEGTPTANNTTFTSKVYLARQLLPVLQAIQDSLQGLYEERQFNIVARLDLGAREGGSPFEEDAYFYDLKFHLNHILEMMEEEPGTAKALLGANLIKILTSSANFFAARGQTLSTELKDNKIF